MQGAAQLAIVSAAGGQWAVKENKVVQVIVKQNMNVFDWEPVLVESQHNSVIAKKIGRTAGQALGYGSSQSGTRVGLRACMFSFVDILHNGLQVCSFPVLN